MKSKLLNLCLAGTSLLIMSCASSQASKKNGDNLSQTAEKKESSKNGIKPYDKVITKDAITDAGLFKVHKVEDNFFYEIPDSLFNRE
ncbi:MAG: DUF5118 domain-containing protein, partial [Leeuwenhoekiella sp.]